MCPRNLSRPRRCCLVEDGEQNDLNRTKKTKHQPTLFHPSTRRVTQSVSQSIWKVQLQWAHTVQAIHAAPRVTRTKVFMEEKEKASQVEAIF